jgi:hypothetical protein
MPTQLDGEEVLKRLQQEVLSDINRIVGRRGDAEYDRALLRKVHLYSQTGEALKGIIAERIMLEREEYVKKMLETAMVVKGPVFEAEGGDA